MDITTRPTGTWLVTNSDFSKVRLFLKKHEALEYATVHNHSLRFHFYDKVWETFDKSQLGKHSLTHLYADRARQLRDKYDYLVLHYSGGSDSHNVLHTFLTNNIKLDEVTVRWPKHWIDGKFYNANNQDTSAKNAPSEYNYTIEPTLQYLRQHHPEIKINIVDFTENIHSLANENTVRDRIFQMNLSRNVLGSVIQRLDESVDRKMASANVNSIGHIFGIEKPMLYLQDSSIYFYFSDVSFDSTAMAEGTNVEPFYWSGEFPLVAMEQVYQTGLFFKNNTQYLPLLNTANKSVAQVTADINLQQNLLKAIVYKHSWDFNKFQVDKPNIDRSDWYSWVHNTPELDKLNKLYDNLMHDITDGIDDKFLINTTKTPLFAPCRTKLFHLMDLDK